ncbi:hypothetical protein BDF19DRAFT_438895 [Syncephalis fuscata]|nr:hypothetical protein BDF19DRAFT_438895 [Syncephalis fuscata]
MRPFVSYGNAACCSILSVIGIVFLLILGHLFDTEAEQYTESKNSPADPHGVAHACYVAAAIYAGFVVCCGGQLLLHKRIPRTDYAALPQH